jgi:hypothetical protein
MNDMKERAAQLLLLLAIVLVGVVFWSELIWLAGIRYVPFSGYPNELLYGTASVWRNQPFSAHWGLTFLHAGDFASRITYEHGWPVYAGLLCLFLKLIMAVKHVDLVQSQRYVPLLTVAAFAGVYSFVVWSQRPRDARFSHRQLITIFLFIGLFLSHYELWNIREASPFNPYPLTIVLFLGAYPFVAARREMSAACSWYALAVGLLFPFYGLLLVLALWTLYHADRPGPFHARAHRAVNLRMVGVGVVLALLLFYPTLVAKQLGFAHGGTALLHRIGLDGQRNRFQSYVQALLHPWGYGVNRPWGAKDPEYRFVPDVALAVCVLIAMGRRVRSFWRPELSRGLFVVLVPYLFSLLMFPQSVSVHPYLYDVLLSIPLVLVALLGAISPEFGERVKGFRFVLITIVLFGFLIHQTTEIAQVGFHHRGLPPLLK